MRKMIATSGTIQAMPRTDAWSLLNLLPNFELIAGRKDGNGMTTPYLNRFDNTTVTMPCSEVYDGFNSAYIANASTATVYPGVYFLNVHVKKNTDYVVGVWLKGEKGNVVVLEVCRQSAVESRPGTGRAPDAHFVNYVTIEKDNEWEYHEMTVNSGAYELIEVNYWISTNGQSAYIAKPSLQESRKGDKGDPGKQGEQGKSATSYRLQLKSGTEAKVVTSGSGDDVKFTLSAIIYYLVIKNTGGSDTEVTDAKFVATIEGKDRTVLYDTKTNKGYYLEYTGTTAYTATNTPQSAIPLTVTLADGTVLNDSIPVTIQPGVAIDIDNKIGKLTTTVAGKADISTLEQTAGRISAKVASLGLRNLLMDSEFRCPVEKTIKRGGKKYREAWNNGTSVTVTDTANGISAEGVNAVKATSAVSDGDWTVTRWYVPAKSGQVYTASAWCMVPDVSVLTSDSRCLLQLYACKDDFTRSEDSVAYGWFSGLSSGEWKRNTCSLTMPQDSAYTYIEVALAAFRCGTVYFRQPQLELGSEATDWTRCADDVEGGLLATGIDIENGKITMTADNVEVRNSSGTKIALFGTESNGTPFLNTDLINAKSITADRLMAFNGDTMLTSINYFGHGEFVQYYADGNKKMEISDGNIIYYHDDTKNSVKWIIGESGTSQSIDNWSTVTLCKTDETGSNVQVRGNLSGEAFSVFNGGDNSTNAKYSGLTVKGQQSGVSPTAAWLVKIPDGWYTNTGWALTMRNVDGTLTANRTLYEYSGGYKTGRLKLISFGTSSVLLPGDSTQPVAPSL